MYTAFECGHILRYSEIPFQSLSRVECQNARCQRIPLFDGRCWRSYRTSGNFSVRSVPAVPKRGSQRACLRGAPSPAMKARIYASCTGRYYQDVVSKFPFSGSVSRSPLLSWISFQGSNPETAHVRFGSFASILPYLTFVRFTPVSDRRYHMRYRRCRLTNAPLRRYPQKHWAFELPMCSRPTRSEANQILRRETIDGRVECNDHSQGLRQFCARKHSCGICRLRPEHCLACSRS